MARHCSNYNQLTVAKLHSLSSNQSALQGFLQTDAGKQIEQKITLAVSNYMRMMEELQYMEEKLPEVLGDLKAIQQKVDKRHKRSNAATIGGCATSIVGGAMIVGGIIAAPFTLGASVGLTAAGIVVTSAGGVTTTTAKGADFFLGASDLKKSNRMVDEFINHYKAAKDAYEAVSQVCQELTGMMPALQAENANILKAIVSTVGFAIDSSRMPKTAFTTGLNALTVCKAAISPAQLHTATKLATAPTKVMPLTRQFLIEAAGAGRCAAKLDVSGFKLAVMTSFRTASVMIKTAGAALAIGGILLDSYTLISAGIELHKNKKCQVSQKISKHIEELEELGRGLEKLNQQLAANVKPINN